MHEHVLKKMTKTAKELKEGGGGGWGAWKAGRHRGMRLSQGRLCAYLARLSAQPSSLCWWLCGVLRGDGY